ncbi:hypothetical protein GRS48_03185 [Halorubrum sp. JWXQ-INN 858]|uniref:hypothetical protein n=1 Tax=Halorubrum sp. JWXQ-INN 858 TaxID=2690782 RepID=UPI00135B556B|nr:hypothetical protein [Halorubrum sp. JWXQ-INN 858]MWV63831.1 hypothetical protein [Halorubrum sp. JWXQ-INN 858]
MATLDITEADRDRIDALREELEATHAGPYASVGRDDVVAYLLDLAEAVDDPDRLADPAAFDPEDAAEDVDSDATDDADSDAADVDTDAADVDTDAADSDAAEDAAEDAANDGGSGQLNAMLSLLDTHADKWREADGDARYEVDLPDGTAETARTKDDVRAILFKRY